MKGLILVILIGMVISFLSKGKKGTTGRSSNEKKTIFDDWAKSFSGETKTKEQVTEPVRTTSANHYKEEKLRKNKVEEDKQVNITENQNKAFDVKKAIVYSTILNKPYNY